tara:strand:+ start:641 stop:844 length:204 start_codon:yes stop_codon:yes gene_type:complete
MGRITPTQIQRLGKELITKYPKEFTKNFEDNKKQVDKFAEIQTKKLRNRLAGFITRSVKNKKEIKLN